jgi:hypothetical protein
MSAAAPAARPFQCAIAPKSAGLGGIFGKTWAAELRIDG